MLIGSPSRKELYVFRTDTIWPTSIETPSLSGVELERNASVGLPEPNDNNRDFSESFIVNGTVLAGEEHARIETGDNSLQVKINPGAVSYDLSGSNKSQKTNRFTIKYADDLQEYVPNLNWEQCERTGEEAELTDGPYTYNIPYYIRFPIVEDNNGIYYQVMLGTLPSNDNVYKIFIMEYNPAVTGGRAIWSIKATSQDISNEGLANPKIAACYTHSGEVIIIVVNEGIRDSFSGSVDIFTYIPQKGDVDILDRDIFNFANTTDTIIDGGCSIEMTEDEKCVIALGISRVVDLKVNVNEIERSVYIAVSEDLVTWTSSYDGKNALGRIEVKHGDESGYAITDVDVLESSLGKYIYAATSNGLVLKSDNDGSSWEKIKTPASYNFPLYSIKAMTGEVGEDIVVYAGGYAGFLMRSINGGSTWKIIAAPQTGNIYDNILGFEVLKSTVWRYDFRPGRSIDAVISSEYGWTNADLELPTEQDQNPALEGQIIVPGLDRNIHTLLKLEQKDQTGNITETKLIIIHGKGVMVLNQANNTDIEHNWIRPELRTNKAKKERLFPLYKILSSGFITSGTIVGEDILLVGNFNNTERDDGKMRFIAKDGWSNNSHFLRISSENNFYNPASEKNWDNPNVYKGFYFSTEQDLETQTENVKSGMINTITDVCAINDSTAYGIDENGTLVLWTKDLSATEVLETGHKNDDTPPNNKRDRAVILTNALYDLDKTFTDISIAQDPDQGGITSILVQNDKSEIYRSVNNGKSWQKFIIDNAPITESQYNKTGIEAVNWRTATTFDQKLSLGDVVAINPETIVTGTGNQLIVFSVGQRVYPCLKRMSNGFMFLTTSDLERGVVDVWKSYGKDIQDSSFVFFKKIAPNVSTKEDSTGYVIQFNPEVGNTNYSTIPTNVPYSNIFELPEGIMAIYAGSKIAASITSDGTSWMERNDPLLPIELIWFNPGNLYSRSALLRCASYFVSSNGRWFATITTHTHPSVSRASNTFESRRWTQKVGTGAYEGMPILFNKEQWIGLSDLSILWTTVPRMGSLYTLPIEYQFPKENMAKESPSFAWKTGNLPPSIASGTTKHELHLYFDRQDEKLAAVLGVDGTTFFGNALGLVGTNFPYMNWAVTVPDYNENSWPTDKTKYTEFNENCVVAEGIFHKPNHTGSYIVDTSQYFEPNNFANGYQTYYIMIQKKDAGDANFTPDCVEIRKIIKNTKDTIYYEGAPIDFTDLWGDGNYRIFGDRFLSICENGHREGEITNPAPPLIGTEYQNFRWLRITIPCIYLPPEGYISIGTPFLGNQLEDTFTVEGSEREGTRYSTGWRWNVLSNTFETTASSGISSAIKVGANIHQFSLSYDQIEDWEMRIYTNFLSSNNKQAFILAPNPNRLNEFLYVRLMDDPQFTQDGSIHFSHGVNLKTVL